MGQRDVERRLGRLLTDAAVQQCFLQDRAWRGRVSFVEPRWRRTSSRRCFACHADDWGACRRSSTTGSVGPISSIPTITESP
jgi:hypothetical protein